MAPLSGLRSSRRLLSATAIFVVMSTGCGWAQFRSGPNHAGESLDTSIELANVPGLVQQWSATTNGGIESSPAVVGGRVFVGSSDGGLYAYDSSTGLELWSATTGGAVSSSPAVSGDAVYVGSDDNTLSAFASSTGSLLWSVSVDTTFAGISSAPTVANGIIYVASTVAVYSYDAGDGSLLWSAPTPTSDALSAPAFAGGLVYVASYADATVWAYQADTGALAWSTAVPGTHSPCTSAASSPAVVDAVVYVALCPASSTPQESAFAFDAATGAGLWSAGAAANTTSPAVAQGAVFVGSDPGQSIEARSTDDGSLLWQASVGGAVVSSPAVANGVVYIGSDDGKLYAFDAAGLEGCGGQPVQCNPLWSASTGGAVRSSPAVADGRVYVGSDDGALYAYSLPPISFTKSTLAGSSSMMPTAASFGPDGRLYVAQFDGLIKVYTVVRSVPDSYQVTATETITIVQQIPNHDDDGTLNPTVTDRLITGLLVTGSAASPVLYVSSSDPRTGDDDTETDLDTNSGIVSRLTNNATGWEKQDLVRGLPRSRHNHATNDLVVDQATNTLYVGQGGNTNMGAPSNAFDLLPEYAYSAAILSIDLDAIGAATYDLPTLVDEDNPTNTGPFGGNGGKHQAKITGGSPVQVYAPGFRNPFALVMTRAGNLYAIDNGPNAGWGDVPIGEGPGGTCTNDINEPGVGFVDGLHLLAPGYYGGHPNPTRGNLANTFNPTNPQSPVPVANPVECDYRDLSTDGSIASIDSGTTGADEYETANFAGQLDGDLLIADIHGEVHRVQLDATGTAVEATDVLFSNAGFAPLDVVAQGNTDPHPGTIWVPDFGTGAISVFEPADFGGAAGPSSATAG